MALPQQLEHAFARLRADAVGAEAEFRAVLESAPDLIEALFGIEMAKFRQGKPHAAGKTLARLVDDGARMYPAALAEAGVLLAKTKQFELARKVLRKGHKRSILERDGLVALAECEMALGAYDVAESMARQALALSPGDVVALHRLARILDRTQKYEAAIGMYRQVLEIDARHPATKEHLARCLHAIGDIAQAEEMCASVIADDPYNTIASFVRAQCMRQRQEFHEADKLLLNTYSSHDFDETRTRMFRSIPNPREDALELRRIVESFWALYSEVLEGQGWFGQAMAESQAPVQATPDLHRPEILSRPSAGAANTPRLTLVSYASEAFQDQQHKMCKSAFDAGNFDRVVRWTMPDLRATQFYRDHRTLLELRRGGGYWIWKPFVLWNEMLCAEEGECLVYCDVGRGDGFGFRQDARNLMAWCDANNHGFLPGVLMPKVGANRLWTKRDCFRLMDCDSSTYWDHPQISATFSAWKNTPSARNFLREWIGYAVDPRVVTDFPNVCGAENLSGFIDHRADQSILSNLVIRHGISLPVFNSKDMNAFLMQMPK